MMMMKHLVLLGDSIFDNAAYVPGGRPAVIDQVRERLGPDWRATLLARDGSVIKDVHHQLAALPSDATHLVLSAGGNDVLSEAGILNCSAGNVGQGLLRLVEVRDRFEGDYRTMMEAIRERNLPAIVCTIYNPCSPDAVFQKIAATALCLFNDTIIRCAYQFRFAVIDLRAVCTTLRDYANQIEPSAAGGAKIAQAICESIGDRNVVSTRTVFFP
jgi:hypothetical protein